MIVYYLNLLYNSFGINLWILLIIVIIALLAILFIIFMSLLLFLDSVYRPNIPQYPFNFILDRVVPAIAIISPSIIILFLYPFQTWFARLTLLVVIHSFVLTPIFHYWSKLRNWYNQNHISYNSWNHPRLYFHITLAIIYPLLWGIFFSLSRFLRLGITYDVWYYIKLMPQDIILILFILPYTLTWILIIIFFMSKMRQYLWYECSTLLYSIHIYLLHYYFYFKFMELLYKTSFFFTCILTLNITYKNKITKLQRITNYLYYHPKWITFIVLSFILFETIFTKKLYYGVYIIFIYTSIYKIISCFFAYGQLDFVFDCCYSDYCFLTDKNLTLRYPQRFWTYFQDAEHYYGFQYDYTQKQWDILKKEMEKPKAQWILRKKVSQDIHQDYLNLRIFKRSNSNFNLRMAAYYLHLNRVRWTHTERLVNSTLKYHSCTAFFVKKIFDNIVLLNNSWGNLNHIQAARVITPTIIFNMYKPFNSTFVHKRKDFIGIQEENIPSNFIPLIEKGVVVEPYDQH